MSMKGKQAKIDAAFGRLADMTQSGHLRAVADIVEFLDIMVAELKDRRAECEMLRNIIDTLDGGAVSKEKSRHRLTSKTAFGRLKMETKYAGLIEQFERVTEAYEAALTAVKTLETATGKLPDVLGVSGGIIYLGDKFEKGRAIHLDSKKFTAAAIDCGSDFSHEDRDEYIYFECTLFGYRVFALFRDDERGYAELKEKVEADTTHYAIDK